MIFKADPYGYSNATLLLHSEIYDLEEICMSLKIEVILSQVDIGLMPNNRQLNTASTRAGRIRFNTLQYSLSKYHLGIYILGIPFEL